MTTSFTLEQAKVGQKLLIKAILDDETATIAMRLGVSAGELITVASKIPGGPVVIRQGGMEIALGRDLCRGIEVEPFEGPRR
ncbi:ferrous iron transport protein A [Vampirovibrio sp.]|uniref:FeoA family protein n=1 Tax=Vampirovibrio sp. TaxID=2717857 RepID=UPI003593C132